MRAFFWYTKTYPALALKVVCCFLIACSTQKTETSSLQDISAVLQHYPRLNDNSTGQEIARVTTKITQSNGINSPEIILLDTHDPFAAAVNNRTLLLSSGMLLRLQSEAELAFLIAHEISHITLGHSFAARDKERVPDEELEADSNALKMVTNATYDPRQAIGLILREAKDSPQSLYPERVTRLRSLLVTWAMAPLPGIVSTREFDEVIYRLKNK